MTALLCVFLVLLISSCGQSQKKEIDINKINDETILVSLIEKSIEESDFTKARQINARYYEVHKANDQANHRISSDQYYKFREKICKAQVSSLIDRGQYSVAADVASEDLTYGAYYTVLMGKLFQLYDKDPQGLKSAILSIQFPVSGMRSDYWPGDGTMHFYYDDLNKLIIFHNNSLEQLMQYVKANNDMEYVKQISLSLKPSYKSFEQPYGSREYEKTPTDYTQVNQIKKDLGIK